MKYKRNTKQPTMNSYCRYEHFISEIAKFYTSRSPYSYDELLSEANEGFINAISMMPIKENTYLTL